MHCNNKNNNSFSYKTIRQQIVLIFKNNDKLKALITFVCSQTDLDGTVYQSLYLFYLITQNISLRLKTHIKTNLFPREVSPNTTLHIIAYPLNRHLLVGFITVSRVGLLDTDTHVFRRTGGSQF